MKDYLKDIIKHTLDLTMIKVTGTEESTKFIGMTDKREVVIDATFKTPIQEFIGTFGIPNIAKLGTILGITEYDKEAIITVKTQVDNGVTVPCSINFTNKAKDFNNEFRFMREDVVNEKIKNMSFKEPRWHIDIQPSLASIQRLKFQSTANSDEPSFFARTDDKKNLIFYFGNQSTNSGSFVFATDVEGTLSKSWRWPVKAVQAILDLPGEKNLKISDDGVAMITVDSGIAVYKYIMPGQSK